MSSIFAFCERFEKSSSLSPAIRRYQYRPTGVTVIKRAFMTQAKRERSKMDALFLDDVLRKILDAFAIVYADFNGEGYRPYRERGIGGFVRFDEGKIFFDIHLPPEEEDRTWAHEVLSVYYYWLEGLIRHDDEVEMEARRLCEDASCVAVLRRYQRLARKGVAPGEG